MIRARHPVPITRSSARIRRPGGSIFIWAGGAPRISSGRGLEVAESEALLDEVWRYATRDELTWYNTWRVGDVVLWDNRCTMHRRDPFDASSRRIMHRTQMKGEARPVA